MRNLNENNLIEDYLLAQKGRNYWIEIKNRFALEKSDCLILYSAESNLLLDQTKIWLPLFAEKKHYKKTVFVSTEKIYFTKKEKGESDIFTYITSEEELDCLLKYYRLTQFTKNIYAICLSQPFGNDFMIGHKGITFKDWLRNFG